MVYFRFNEDGVLKLEDFGEATLDVSVETAYPIMSEALFNAPRDEEIGDFTLEGMNMVKAAVAKERLRVKVRRAAEPSTELGRRIKTSTDAPSCLVDRIVCKMAGEELGRFRPRGKPN